MSPGTEIIQLVFASSSAVMTIIAALRARASAKKTSEVAKIQIGDKEWTVDPSKMSREEIERLLGELTERIESEAPEPDAPEPPN